MARTRTRSTGARRTRRRAAAWGRRLQDRLLPAMLALALSFGAILNTVGVAAHNLGARPGLHFVNGGKIFLPRGAMWYHIPGLGDLDLAPQNIGGQGNLRNGDVAVLDRNPARLQSMDVDFSLAPGAYALLILEQSGEGSLLALRLSAMTDPASPFDNALVRFVDGEEVQRQPLPELGPTLDPGRHQLRLGPAGATSQLRVDGRDQPLDLDLAGLRPALALGSGERDLSLHRWAVSGLDAQGAATTQVLAWSRLETVGRWGLGLLQAAGALWLLLVGAPVLAVAWDSRQAPDRLLVAATLRRGRGPSTACSACCQ